MPTVEILLLSYLTITTFVIIARTRKEAKAIKLQRYIEQETNCNSSSVDFLGYSVLCTNIEDISLIEKLLTSEFYRYEVIISINSANQRELFHAIIKHYKLVEVNNSFPQEISSSPIIALYRSRLRGYRRLIVADIATTNQYDALNAALNISSYDYIIPIIEAIYLRPNAISAIAFSLSQERHRNPELIYCATATPCYIFQRDALIDRGGFSSHIVKSYPAATTLCLHINLTQRYDDKKSDNTLIIILLCIITGSTIALILLLMSLPITLCLIATFSLAVAAARYILILDNGQNCSVKALLYQISNITSFFRSRKFTIS